MGAPYSVWALAPELGDSYRDFAIPYPRPCLNATQRIALRFPREFIKGVWLNYYGQQ